MKRRDFLRALGAGAATVSLGTLVARRARAQQPAPTDSTQRMSSASNVEMDGSAYREVRRDPKPGARPQLTVQQRDDLEHQIGCACPCTLDVFTCRTTDFSCGISPQMHRDVLRLVDGGYSGQEILDSFVAVYGEQALMAPRKQGFNWVGWTAPFVAIGTGGLVLAGLIRRWGQATPAPAGTRVLPVDATPDELARLEAAVRDEEPRA